MDIGSKIKPQLIINIFQSFQIIFSILQWFVSQKHNGAVGNLNAMKCIRHRISALLIKLCWHKHAAMSHGIKRQISKHIVECFFQMTIFIYVIIRALQLIMLCLARLVNFFIVVGQQFSSFLPRMVDSIYWRQI